MLFKMGFSSVKDCSDGNQCIQLLSEANQTGNGYNLLILDIKMPKANGINVLEFIKANSHELHLKNLKVIVITACTYTDQFTIQNKFDVWKWIQKPMDWQQLYNACNSLYVHDIPTSTAWEFDVYMKSQNTNS